MQAGQVLFNEGDKSDGMFLLRAGELLVYLEKDGEEIELAKIAPGGVTPNKYSTHYSCVIRTLYFGRNGCL
ncbi:MAG: cyclic nucleotide-binding domain-containing protein, partial [Oligoflexales bacterium]|nr:cyclic nucleotide-binding domain-containing protein [Oligoflexales bacterium]